MKVDVNFGPVGLSGLVLALVADMSVAARIVKSAQSHFLKIRNFDRAAKLLDQARIECPALVILDWDGREAESYQVLKGFRENADLKKTAVVGFVSKNKEVLKAEAQRAGCFRVYYKTEFFKELSDLWMRYGK